MIQEGKRYKLETDYPIAVDSPDHYNVFGTACDNNSNRNFNQKLYELDPRKPLRILDLGVAGGLSVKHFIEDGHFAVGLEGSNYRKERNIPEWDSCTELFLCDLTKPFEIYERSEDGFVDAKFDYIFAWEFLEHISIRDIKTIYQHVKRLLKPGGGWIVSISVYPTEMAIATEGQHWGDSEKWGKHPFMGGFGFHHQLVRSQAAWDGELIDNGFKLNHEKLSHFEGQFVRAPGISCPIEYTVNRYIEVST